MSQNVFNLRISRIQSRIKEEGLDAIIVCSPQNVYYLSGFNPIIFSQPIAVIIPLRGDAILITHSIRFKHANKEAFLTKIKIFGKWGKYGEGAPQDFFSAVKITLQELSLSRKARIGIDLSSLPYPFFLKFKLDLCDVEFLNIDNIIRDERMIKDEIELEFIKDAACITDAGMEVAIDAVRERKSEIEVSVNAMVTMLERWKEKYPDREVVDFANGGSIQNALWAVCLSGPRINLMCDSPSSRIIKEGDLVLIMIFATINGYHAENERTIAVGSAELEQEKAYNAVIRARNEAINEIRPGIPICSLYNTAIRIMTEEGYGNILPGRIGHGLGLNLHEAPSIAPDNRDLLKERMVVTFEPGLDLGELGGIQNSDTILVNSHGFEYLTHTKRGFLNV